MDYTVTPLDEIAPKVAAARARFTTGATKPIEWRRATLERVRELVQEREAQLLDALAADFGKPRFEAWITELGFTVSDINHILRAVAFEHHVLAAGGDQGAAGDHAVTGRHMSLVLPIELHAARCEWQQAGHRARPDDSLREHEAKYPAEGAAGEGRL